jgi:hypothetical protein
VAQPDPGGARSQGTGYLSLIAGAQRLPDPALALGGQQEALAEQGQAGVAGVGDPLRQVLAGQLGDHGGERADQAGCGVERWGSRLEFYLTDPAEEPDMSKWETQLAFRLAD